MASKKKIIKEDEINKTEEEITNKDEVINKVEEEVNDKPKKAEVTTKKPKYAIGSIVVISKEAEADLNGFKLFPQYKKYTYTVEAYDEKSGVYSLRRLNLSLRLKEGLILSPEERAHDAVNRRQF